MANTKLKQSAPSGSSRRDKLASLEAARKKEQRRRTISLLVVCRKAPGEVERMPEPRPEDILGVAIPRIELWPFEAAGPAKLRRALEHLGGLA